MPKSWAHIFFPHFSRAQHFALARTRKQEIKQQFRNTLNNKNFESYFKLSRVQKQQTSMDLFL